ncbi:hypothetical protein P2P98_03200 [Microbacterium sp. Kw_RZR3]|uniref:hypothetical protein n=1 Tax=Microbacterium sp. Kw_RZR3 TaxID=3032903 RepID=UPI0023D9C935|nr:hypothetical protein [Microbacterium sp. Kw_RZR3]MDF2045156.1 hypothetical protein [Microbacterium sp. Kw_RZR3]
MVWQVVIYEAITGRPIEEVFPVSASWNASLFGASESTFSFKMGDAETGLTREKVRSLFRPNARLMALQWGDFVMLAGKIESWKWDESRTVTVTVVDFFRTETAWRLTDGVGGNPVGTLDVTNRSLSGAARAVMARFMQWGPDWAYPIDLPADGPGTFTESWVFWKGFKILDLIEQIEAQGVEVYLRPYLTTEKWLRFQMRVENRITIGASSFHLGAEITPLSGIEYECNGSQQITGGQGLGNGKGEMQLTASAYAPTPLDRPIRDTKKDFPDLVGDRLQEAVNSWVAEESEPVEQLTVGAFQIDAEWSPEESAPGRAWNLDARNHDVVPDGRTIHRVISVRGTLGMTLNPEVQRGS